jgi:hypothetical protein
MSDVDEFFENSRLAAKQSNYSALDADPEQAARAVDLSASTGVPSTAIYGDLDGFERAHKAALGSAIISDNEYIADYLNSHPMAPRISHDDLGALDDHSRSLTALPGESRLQKWLKSDSVAKSFSEGFGQEPFGQTMFKRPSDLEWAISHPEIASVAGAAAMPIEFLARATGGLLHMGYDGMSQVFGEKFAREMTAMAEWGMMRGDLGVKAAGGPAAMIEGNADLLRKMRSGLETSDLYTTANREPPVGIHPLLDDAKKLQTKEDLDGLDEALRTAQKSATRDRSPDFFANFVRGHVGDREIGISADAVRQLYGDKPPTVDDNLLGWIPDIDKKLIAAEGVGGDVQVPIADWLAKVDPEVAKALHDDIRVRDGGLTVNEGKIEAEPKEVISEPVPATRGSAGLEPMFSVGDRKITLERKAAAEGTRFGPEQGFHDFDILDENGKVVGAINLSLQKGGKQVYIEDIHAGPRESKYYDPNFLGPSLVRDLRRQLKEAFPQAEELTGHRATGARWKGKPDTAIDVVNPTPVIKLDLDGDVQPFRDLLTPYWEDVGSGLEALFHIEGQGLAADSPMGQMVLREIRRLAPEAGRDVAHALDIPTAKYRTSGAYVPNLRSIFVSLESKDPIGTARHEAIHALRDMQLFTDAEWRNLEASSLQHGWVEKYRIKEKWGKLDPEMQVEESIAEAFRDWRNGQLEVKDPTVFQRIKDFFDGLLKQIAEKLGVRNVTWDQIFESIDSGEIGAREQIGEAEQWKKHEAEDIDPQLSVEEPPKPANDPDAFGKDKFKSYGAAARDQLIKKTVDKDTHVGDYAYWQKIAEKENIGGRLTNTPNGYFAARKYSEGDKTTMLIDPEGVRTVYKDGNKVVKELHRDVTKPKFQVDEGEGPGLYDRAKALGVTQSHMDRMLRLIEKRNAEDLDAAQKRAEVRQRRRSNKEWKERRTTLRDEVRESLQNRPDLAMDELFSKNKIKLDPATLSEDQRARLPKDYIQKKDGVSPDDLAPYFGYTSGDALVERLGMLTEERRRSGMSAREFFNRLVDVETDRRLNAEFGDRQQSILDEAKDQALSETQLNLTHEETLAYALKAGAEPQFTKEQTRAMVKQVFDDTPVGQISSDRLLQKAGTIGKKIEEAGAKGKWDEAYRLSQQRNHAVIAAKLARDYERQRAQFDRTAKQFRKREVANVPAEYTNWIHDILQRTGNSVNRSIQDLQENIARQGETTLEDFVSAKEAEWMGLRELPVADFLLDTAFRKPVDDLSHRDFIGLKSSLDSLIKAGRDEGKIYREGEAADRAVVLQEMRDKLATFPMKQFPATRGRLRKAADYPRAFIAGMTNIETLLNRWDRADPNGIFNRYVTYPLAKASNYKNVLQRQYDSALKALGRITDRDKLVDAPFADPLSRTEANPNGTPWTGFTRNNVMAMLQNAGNKSNWTVLARGYGADPEALMQWLHRNTTKEDWDRAQKMGDTVFKPLVATADRVYERLTGATIEKIPLEKIQTPFGEYKGWYHPLIADPLRKEVWEQHPDTGAWERRPTGKKTSVYDDDFFHASTANGYTKKRTGATYPLDLNFDVVPSRIRQMIHDIAFREPILETQKVFDNRALQAEVTKHYGPIYTDLLMPYLRGLAGAESINSKAGSMATKVSETLRQNTISTLIGFNPYTALKHGPTAWVMSMREVGGKDFLNAVTSLYGKSAELGLSNSQFAMKWSEELQRRERHWQDTIAGEHQLLGKEISPRERIIQAGSWLVAQSDMMSAKPTWIAQYEKSITNGLSHGDAIDLADRAVRRAHGSTAQTNQPALVRGGGPLHGWLTSVYGFFGTAMQRRIEIAHELNDAYHLVSDGEIKSAASKVPGITADIFTYVIWPTIVEEWVTGLTTDDRRGWGTHLAAGAFMGLSSSVLYLRDLMHAFVTGQDPSVGLLSTPLHDANNVLRQFKKGREALDRKNAGKTIGDTLTVFGEMTGMAPKTIANAIRFGIDLVNKQAHPKSLTDYRMGLTRGTEKKRVEK